MPPRNQTLPLFQLSSARASRERVSHAVKEDHAEQQGAHKVNKPLFLAAIAATLVVPHATAHRAAAQPRGPAPAIRSPIAIIDLAYIFENHTRFKQMNDDLRRDVEAAEAELKSNKAQLQKMVDNLDQYNRTSQEYRTLEEDITKRQAELQVQVGKQKRDFYEQEAKIYYSTYKEVMDQVRYYAEKNNILLVMRFQGDPYNENDPQGLQKELNKPILYHNIAIDITPFILEAVNPPRPNGRQPAPQVGIKPGRPMMPPKQRK
jgi:Skp family chaperone for outer membrane proteins